jgi:hypothetical protein
MPFDRLLLGLLAGLAGQLGRPQQLQQLQGVIGRRGFQLGPVAAIVAIRRWSPCRFSCATSAPIPYRASGVTFASIFTRDRPDPMMSATWCSALTICGPDARADPVRHSSSGDSTPRP